VKNYATDYNEDQGVRLKLKVFKKKM